MRVAGDGFVREAWERSGPRVLGGEVGPVNASVAHACRAVQLLTWLGPPPGARVGTVERWVERIQAGQDEVTGRFADAGDGAETTCLALQALDAAGIDPRHRLAYADPAAEARLADAWFDGLGRGGPRVMATEVASVLAALVRRVEDDGDVGAAVAYHRILDRLVAEQDPGTGLLGGAAGQDRVGQVEATGWLVPFFGYVRRPLERVSRLAGSVLAAADRDVSGETALEAASRDLAVAGVLAALGGGGPGTGDGGRWSATLEGRADDGLAAQAAGEEADVGGVEAELELLWTLVQVRALAQAGGGRTDAAVPARLLGRRPGPGCRVFTGALTEDERRALPLWYGSGREAPGRPPDGLGRAADPVISVVIPCHDLGGYLPQAIESLRAQTEQDFEVIVVDDGSTDEFTVLLLDALAGREFRLIRQANAGVAEARNHGIREAAGRYICCLDPDDGLRPGFFAQAVRILDSEPGVGLVSGHFRMFDERDDTCRFESCALPELLVHNRAVEPAVFRRSAWEQVAGYWGGFSAPGIEDWDLWIRIVTAGYRAAVIPEVVWDYRIRPGQMSEGMYEPDTWATLCGELAGRHEAHYRSHAREVFALLSRRWADLRRYTGEQERGASWWAEQAGVWERVAEARAAELEELRNWAAELEGARGWWQGQAESWEREAMEARARLEKHEARLAAHEAPGAVQEEEPT